ncbi:MAG: competence/damage-inducible protein A [Pseudobdellovibrionaceae bacterium]
MANLKAMKISILSIGTELTTGQILNRNAQWISQKLKDLGLGSTSHLVVPDDESLILKALQFCAETSNFIFVTGGLGPTSDDFTRDVICRWTGRKLIWDESSWKHIEERLISRGMAVKEIQKQQCYFPEGSRLLPNRMGTANGFQLNWQQLEIFVLPGPPREIEAIWQDWIAPQMREKMATLDPEITRSWDTLGFGESDVADRVEEALKGCPFEKGYRVHMPFVEVKLTYRKSQSTDAQKWILSLEKAIGSITPLRDGENAAEILTAVLSEGPEIFICDEIPGSFLLQRLFPFCRQWLKNKKFNFVTSPLDLPQDPQVLCLFLKEDGPGFGRAGFKWKGQSRQQNFVSPYKSSLLREREQQFYAEMALIFWMKELAYESSNPKFQKNF